MSKERNGETILTGEVLEENHLVSLADLCRSCTVEAQTVTTLVSEGILDPMGKDMEHWQFTISSLKRVKTVVHLQRDLRVNLAGAALALELLDRIAELEGL